MRRGELYVFMTKVDEIELFRFCNLQHAWVVNGWVRANSRIKPLDKPPLRPEEVEGDKRGFYRGPLVLSVLPAPKRSKVYFFQSNAQLGYRQIDDGASNLIRYYRGFLGKKHIGMGHFLIDTYVTSKSRAKILIDFWDDLKKWVNSTCFKLPQSDGYLGPDATKLALKIGEVVSQMSTRSPWENRGE